MSTNVEQIKERLNIVDVISSYIQVEKAGINFKAKCPFHHEKTASFFISPTRQNFYCFGCGEKGDIFSFVQKFEGLDFKEALETLANRAGIKIEKLKTGPESIKEENEKKDLFAIMSEAANFYHQELVKNPQILTYLENRGLKQETIKNWYLGFAKEEWRNLYDHLIKNKFNKETMLKAGLVKKVDNEEKYYDTFRDRVMFPICDSGGKIIAFSGRAMHESDRSPKYLNSPETKLFYKSETLYGFNVAKNHIRKLDYSVLVEGQMDLLMSHQSGISNTVASSGTALTELHLKKLQKISNRLIIAYDADLAGEKAANRAAELALTLGMETKIASLPPNEDPASIAKKDPAKLKKALKEAKPFLDFILEKTIENSSEKNLTQAISKNVLPLVNFLKSEMEKSQFVKKISQKIKVPEEAVWNDLDKVKNQNKPSHDNYTESVDQDREKFIFELEKYMKEGDKEKISVEQARRSEFNRLKHRLREIGELLDDPNIEPTKEQEIREEFKKIEKIIKDLN